MAHIYKSSSVELLDKFFSVDDDLAERYANSLELLDSYSAEQLANTTRDLATNPRFGPLAPLAEEADLFQERWLDPIPDAAETMRGAYHHAIELAMGADPPKPLETIWISDSENPFEMHVTETDERVVVYVKTPVEPPEPPGSRHAVSHSWVFRPGEEGQQIQ